MRRSTATLKVALLATALAQGAMAQGLPSGLEVELYDLVLEPEASLARFRFLAPDLAARDYEEIEADLPWLCRNVGLPELEANGWTAETLVISLGDREVPLGQMDSDAVQYFEAFRVAEGDCILELF